MSGPEDNPMDDEPADKEAYGAYESARDAKVPLTYEHTIAAERDTLRAENERLRAEVTDADLLLGFGWQEAVSIAKGSGETSQVGALAIQCTRLAGDVAVLRAELEATDCSYSDEEAAHLDTIRLLEAAQAQAAVMRGVLEGVQSVMDNAHPCDGEQGGIWLDIQASYPVELHDEIDDALASDAGQAFQRRLAAAESLLGKGVRCRAVGEFNQWCEEVESWRRERDG